PPIGLGGFHLRDAECGHLPGFRQPRDVLAIDLTPDALLASRSVALKEALVVEAFAESVDPSPHQCDVERFRVRDALKSRSLFPDLEPSLVRFVVVLSVPRLERFLVLESVDLRLVDLDRRHQRAALPRTDGAPLKRHPDGLRLSRILARLSGGRKNWQ